MEMAFTTFIQNIKLEINTRYLQKSEIMIWWTIILSDKNDNKPKMAYSCDPTKWANKQELWMANCKRQITDGSK